MMGLISYEITELVLTEYIQIPPNSLICPDHKRDPETSVVLVFRYDRFSRSAYAPGQQADLLKHGVRIESVEEGYFDPDSEIGAIMMPMTWGLNRLQSLKLSNIVTPNMKTNVQTRDPESGWAYKNGGIPMWGYKAQRVKVGRSSKHTDIHRVYWVLDDTVVAGKPIWEWARTILLEWRLKERLGYRLIANRLTELGIPTASGKQGWSESTIYSLISDWVVVENAHPAIITEEQCDLINKLVHKPNRGTKPAAKPKSRFILSGGLTKCVHCGSNLAGAKRHAGDYYTCGAHLYRRGAGCEKAWYVPKDQLEDLVFRQLMTRITAASTDLLVSRVNAELDAQWSEVQKSAPQRQQRIAELEEQLNNLLDVAAAGAEAPEMAGKISSISQELHDLRELDRMNKPERLTAAALKARAADVEKAYASVDPDVRKAAMRHYVLELLVDSRRRVVEGKLRDPLNPRNDTSEPDSGSLVYRDMVAPKGTEGMYIFKIKFGGKRKYAISLVDSEESMPEVASPHQSTAGQVSRPNVGICKNSR